MKTTSPSLVCALVWFVCSVCPVLAAVGDPDQSLKGLSLEELGNIEVTTVSKAPEELRRTPAAVYVITQDDIRRSGATSLPEVLRMAPGLDVARIDSTHWSVGVRGFGDQFSKSLLVLIDGRSVYTPLFAGVFWALQDTLLDDIDRIEVIRGPGGTIWGANAVTGVINIVTKSSADTKGVAASIASGNVDHATIGARYGAGHGANLTYRLYGKGARRGAQSHSDGQDFDTARMTQIGGRTDWKRDRDSVTVQGDAYTGTIGQSVSLATYSPPTQVVHYEPFDVSGGNIAGSWEHALGTNRGLQVHGYYDYTSLAGPQLGETRHTFDVDFNHRFPVGRRQRVTWGAGARLSPSTVTQTVPTLDLTPHNQTATIASVFGEDVVALVPDHLSVTVGSKFERYTYTGLEVQPSARLLWTPTEQTSFWLAATRAVRTPSRLERDFSLTGLLSASPVPTYVRIAGNPDFSSERLHGYEAGYHGSLRPSLYLAVAGFYNDHANLESFGPATVVVEDTPPPTHVLLRFPYVNGVAGRSKGVEISPTWRPMDWWQLRGFYTYLKLDLRNMPGNTDTQSVATYEGSSPRHQGRFQSSIDLPRAWAFDQVVRYASPLRARAVASYTAVDMRLGGPLEKHLQLAIAAQNLFDAAHAEFGHDPGPTVEVRRSVVVTVTWAP